MASFRESIDALKKAGLADSEILEIMSESVDGQMLTKKSSFNKESWQELPTKNKDTTNETPSVRKRKADALSTEKQPKTIRQSSPRYTIEREEVHFDYSFDRVPLSPLSIALNRFSFSADMEEASDLAERALNGYSPNSPKGSQQRPPKTPISLLKAPQLIKNHYFWKFVISSKTKSSCGIYSMK